MTTLLIEEESFLVSDTYESETDTHLFVWYDGTSYYVGINEYFSVSDEMAHDSAFSLHPTSRAFLLDAAGYDITTTLSEDAEFFIYSHDAVSADYFSDVKKITYDNSGNLLCLSEKFLWNISKATAETNHYNFLYPNLENIIDAKYYKGSIYVLQYVRMPTEIYEIFSDTLAITDSVSLRGQENTIEYLTFFYYPPAPQYIKQKIQEFYVIRISKYNLNGEEEIHFDFQVNNNTQLIAPVQFDIFEDLFYIVDQGDAKIKILTLEGIFVRSISNRQFNIPLQVAVEDADFIWILDSTVSPFYGYKYRIKKIDLRNDQVVAEHPYKNKPFMNLVRSVSAYDMYVIEKPDSAPYKYYKNFVYTHNITMALAAHNILDIQVYKGEHLFILNSNPIEVSTTNLSTRVVKYIRECNNPVTVAGLEIDEEMAVVSDTGLYEVGKYYLYGNRNSVLLNSILPKGIVKIEDSYYISDVRYSSIYKISGTTVTKIYKELVRPTDLATDGTYLFVVDTGGNVIKKLDTDGNLLFSIGGAGEQVGKFNYPLSAVVSNDILYVLDHGNFRIQTFTLNGEFIKQIVLSPPVTFEYTDAVVSYKSIAEAAENNLGDVTILKTGNYKWACYYDDVYNRFLATKFLVTLPSSCIINSAIISFPNISIQSVMHYDAIQTFAENDLNPRPYDETLYYDLSNRYMIETPITTEFYFPGNTQIGAETGELKDLLIQLHNSAYWTPSTYVSFIHRNVGASGYSTDVTFNTWWVPVHNPVLTVDYTRVIYKRRFGFFYYMSVDNDFIYVSDISEKKIKIYNKASGVFIEEFDFGGTIFRPLNDEIFITDKDCSLSYINKFEWGREKEYTLEFTEDQGDLFKFYFTVDWETVFEEPYEKIYAVGMIEDFEWFTGFDYEIQSTDENELLVPEITWVL